MPIYVDGLRRHKQKGMSCLLFASRAIKTLHACAKKAGVPMEACRQEPFLHYRLTSAERKRALENGAKPLGRMYADRIMKRMLKKSEKKKGGDSEDAKQDREAEGRDPEDGTEST